jgi:indole-3-glycerol phosphate synthase
VNILDRILATKGEEVAALRRAKPMQQLKAEALATPQPPSFEKALRRPGGPHLIAEVKKASPSKGIIRADFDPVRIGRQYEQGGAAALSVLTDEQYFQGSLAFLTALRAAVALPLLRKDFIIDDAQVWEARASGASAILLIAAALNPQQLASLAATASAAQLDVLVEVHDEEEIDRLAASRVPFQLVGINNRDLKTFEVRLDVTEQLIPVLRRSGFHDAIIVSESGIFTPAHVARVAVAGAGAVLVGESLMREADPGEAAARLMDPSTGQTGAIQ